MDRNGDDTGEGRDIISKGDNPTTLHVIPSPADTPSTPATAESGSISLSLSPEQTIVDGATSHDWTSGLPDTEHIRFFKETEWASTRLGPLSTWGPALRLHTFSLLADSQAGCIYWGPDHVPIYNENFAPLAGKTHPMLMGSTFQDGFPELWSTIKPVFDGARLTKKAVDIVEVLMFVERNGFTEESYFSGNFSPIRGDNFQIEGFYNRCFEISKHKIDQRRREMINALQVPDGRSTRRLASFVMPALMSNPSDIPMALLYKADEDSVPESVTLHLRGSIGVPSDHPLSSIKLDLESDDGVVPLLRRARYRMITVPTDSRFDGIDWQGFGEKPQSISVLPIQDNRKLFGFLVLGTNPRRPIDDDHYQFMKDISSITYQIASAILSAEETLLKEARLQKEVEEGTRLRRYMAENASVGMQYISAEGKTLWANDEYYRLTDHPRNREQQYKLSFIDVFLEEERPKALEIWQELILGTQKISAELRAKKIFYPPSGDPEPSTILTHSFRVEENGQLKSLMAFTTDISAFKWAQASESRKAAQAEEAKRQQEEFIDFVSHELRNPLTAIFQLAESIITSYPPGEPSLEDLSTALTTNVDNAETILMCAQHQKRIVDDVLTLSKLEYIMLSVSPQPVQLPKLVSKWMKMFEAQLLSHSIKVNLTSSPSLAANNVDWILCDESRVQQIFINLMTNAIKFTKSERRKEISVEFGAVPEDPRKAFSDDICWAQTNRDMEDLTAGGDWGSGQPLYFTLSVTDTGIGMSSEEIHRLFGRFEQANARTTIKYGGSGLGLFLSQRLTEKQTGEIGVVSQPGLGSTFAFYVKSRRTDPPPVRTSLSLSPTSSALPSTSAENGGESQAKVNLEKIHVLLVEDNEVNQKVVAQQLRKLGCVVYTANHGVEALEVIRGTDVWCGGEGEGEEKVGGRKHLDIILMDWEMPIMDGLTCSREIRLLQTQHKLTHHIQIIATTANARDEQMAVAIDAGVDEVVSKPFMVKELLERMRVRLGGEGTVS